MSIQHGTGTVDDPYVVENWAELTEAIADSTAYVTCADNLVIDLLQIYPEGIPTTAPTLLFACKEFDGNGIVIKNAYSLTALSGGDTAVIQLATTCEAFSNFNFINFYINLGGSSHSLLRRLGSTYISIVPNCSFRGIVFIESNQHTLFNYIRKFYNSVFNIKVIATGSLNIRSIYNTTIFDTCWLCIDSNTTWDCANGQQSFYNSYFEGNFKARQNSGKIINIGNSVASVINTNCDAGDFTGCTVYAYNSSLIVINTSKLTGDITLTASSGTPFIECTDSQIKDYNYLAEIFPIVEYEEENEDV